MGCLLRYPRDRQLGIRSYKSFLSLRIQFVTPASLFFLLSCTMRIKYKKLPKFYLVPLCALGRTSPQDCSGRAELQRAAAL